MSKYSFTLRGFVTCVLCLFLVMPALAAGKSSSFSKKYKDERLEVVLNDLCKRTGNTLNVVDPDLDLDKRITATFKDARVSTVLKKVLDSDWQGKAKKGVLTISRKPTPPAVFTVRGTFPTSVIDNDSINEKTYQDTTFTVNCHVVTFADTVVKETQPEQPKPFSHKFQILFGAGYGHLGYTLGDAGKVSGGFSGNAEFRYLFYFTENWGLGLGAGLSYYTSTGVLNTTLQFDKDQNGNPLTDSEGEQYIHFVRTRDWTEQQQVYMVNVPVMLQFMYPVGAPLKNGPARLYGDLGANFGFNISATRRLVGGSIDHLGSYDLWHLDLEHIDDHDFYTEQAAAFGDERYTLDLKLPAIGLMADFGVALPVADNVDIMIGAFAGYTLNNICASTRDLGWQQNLYTGDQAYRNHTFMEQYGGLIGSQFAQSVKPWQAGLRVGVNFTARKKVKAVEPEMVYRRENVCDTTFTIAERVETTVKPKPVVVEKIKRVLDKSVIWFDLNSTEPKLEPADILDKVAQILLENPEQKILITGHASKEGSRSANQRLSEARAAAIASRLMALGVKAEQIQCQGLGVEVDYQPGKHDISLDRRAEITPVAE